MKKTFTTLFATFMIAAQVMAVNVHDVCGRFDGNMIVGGDYYDNRSIYLLPGVEENTVTLVLPDFTTSYNELGDIVLPNIPMDENGLLHLENARLYFKSIAEAASITLFNGLEDEGTTYNSVLSETDAMVVLSIVAPSLPEPIFVLFTGTNARTTVDPDNTELVYNRDLKSFTRNGEVLTFSNNIANIDTVYSDSCATYVAEVNDISAKTFTAFDTTHKCIFIYVIADDYAQTGIYNIYRVDFTDSDAEGLGPKEGQQTGIETITIGNASFEKVLIEGQFFIRRNDALYNASGVRVR